MRAKHAHRLGRTLLLGGSTLGIVAAMFAMFHFVGAQTPLEAPQPVLPTVVKPAASNASQQALRLPEGVVLEGGGSARFREIDRETGKVVFALDYAGWEPAKNARDQFEVTQPRMTIRTPRGQIIEVTAEQGRMEKRPDAKRPRRGELTGHVRIVVDRLSDAERAQLSEAERNSPPGEARLITITSERIEFDLEYSRVASTGPLEVRAVDVSLRASSLGLRFNEVDDTIEHLEIPAGGTIEVTGLAVAFTVSLPGPGSAKSTPVPVATAPEPPPPATPKPTMTADGFPILELSEPKTPKRHPITTYRATFEDDVVVEQRTGNEPRERLTADVLALLFDFGQSQRDAMGGQARTQPTSDASDPSDYPSAATHAASSPVAEHDETPLPEPDAPAAKQRLGVTWSGKLNLDLVPDNEDPDIAAKGKRMHVTATGSPVHLSTQQGEAECQRLEYQDETKVASLFGVTKPDESPLPLVIRSSDSGEIQGREAHFDDQTKTGYVVGPGRLTRSAIPAPSADASPATLLGARSSSDGFEIVFTGRLDLELASITELGADPQTGTAIEKQRDYLKRAVLTDAVRMNQGHDGLSADRVEATFAAPDPNDRRDEKIERLYAAGNVELRTGEERIACREMDVELTDGADGQPTPSRAIATGSVVAQQGCRRITAGERLTVDLAQFETPKPPWDEAIARQRAIDKGYDPDTVDWVARRAEYEASKEYDVAPTRLNAIGQVTIMDPEQSLEVIAESIDAAFTDARTIRTATVLGSSSSPASVKLEDFSIMGASVELDATQPYAHVPGAGRLTFMTEQDLDGRPLDEPTEVVVTWSREMTYRGTGDAKSTANFAGDVHATTQTSTFDCAALLIDFVERPQPVATAQTKHAGRWWILTPIIDRFAGPSDDAAGAGLRVAGTEAGQDPVYLVATGNAVALTSREDETGRIDRRGRIAGEHLAVDLRSRVMKIDGPGNLLIEDYQVPAEQAAPRQPRRTPMGDLSAEGPSQTFIFWTNSMSYDYGNRGASFEGDVELRHFTGAELVLGDQIAAFQPGVARTMDKGSASILQANQLLVGFTGAPGSQQGTGAGIGEMSGVEVKHFQAEGNVWFVNAAVQVSGHQASYSRESNRVRIVGRPGQDVDVIDERDGFKRVLTSEVTYHPQGRGFELGSNTRVVGN